MQSGRRPARASPRTGVEAPDAPGADAARRAARGRVVRPELGRAARPRRRHPRRGSPDATERRHAGGRRTARENIDDLCDPGTFEEYGGLVIAAQRARRSIDDLIANTPADGLVAGIGRVNGDLFDDERSRCAVMSYDYTVLAGTQGQMNHRKKDRLFELVERLRLPVVLFAEGGGGRPGDTDMAVVTGLDTRGLRPLRRAERPACRSSASCRAAASPATPRCSGAATSSSPPPTPTSAWAARP